MQREVIDQGQARTGETYLHMRDITKVYGNGVLANSHVDLEIKKGEIHALMGENGAGKSTLMKVLFGNELPDEGSIEFDGRPVVIDSPKKAVSLGIGMVYQHFNLAESLTVAENVVVGQEPNPGLFFHKELACKTINELASRFGFNISAEELVRNISVGQKQKVEILKILYRNSHLIILDEPTAVLTPQETDELFEQLLLLKKAGYTIIFISHKIDEVLRICDRLTVMRAGRTMGTYPVKDKTAEDISRLMVGRDVVLKMEKPEHARGKTVLRVRDLTYYDRHAVRVLDGASFDLHAGEILGVAGVEGSGQKELSEIIAGLKQPFSGTVELDGESIVGKSIRKIRQLGLSHIHEDRMTYGAAMQESIEENLISIRGESEELGGKLLLSRQRIEALGRDLVEKYSVLCKSPSVPVRMLSGGNIQKVVVAREMSVKPKMLIANQPTRGIDVGAVELIHKKLLEAREEDSAILLISSDLNEILNMSDSLIVFHGGRITGYFKDVTGLTDTELGLYMLGLKHHTPEQLEEALDHENQ